MVLTAVSSPASARASHFTFRGHRIHLHSVRHCRSLSCVSLFIPGVHWRRGRDADDVANSADPAQMPAPSPAQIQPAPAPAQVQPPPPPVQAQPSPPPLPAQPQMRPAPLIAQAAPVPVARTPTAPAPVAVAVPPAPVPVQTRPVPAPTLAAVAPSVQVAPPASKPAIQVTNSTQPPPPSVGFDVAKPAVPAAPTATQPAPQAAPQVARASEESGDEAIDTPIGDWQTEGKGGFVRIEACGEALCGYVLNASTRAKGETVLVNMKAKNVTQWSGNIYSRSSGNSYFGTMTLKEPNTLRVEACAVGKFFCSGNNWTRIEDGRSIGSNEMATSRRHVPGARS
jgi:uncharacterized protein (DUF2147 family)